MKNEAGMGAKLVRDAAILLVITLFSDDFCITHTPSKLISHLYDRKKYHSCQEMGEIWISYLLPAIRYSSSLISLKSSMDT